MAPIINENIFGVTVSGSEIDDGKEPSEDAWKISKVLKTQPEYVSVEFKEGIPIALDGKKMHGSDILIELNKIAGAHGFGRGIYYEDETIGIHIPPERMHFFDRRTGDNLLVD